MIDPWDLIGWLIIIGLGTSATVIVVGFTILWTTAKYRHLTTRNIAPARGQQWGNNSYTCAVTKIYDTGRIALSSGCVSWSDSPDEWKSRVRSRKLWLISY